MDFFSIMFVLVYVIIGYGFDRIMEKVTDTEFGKNCQNNFMTMVLWPMWLVIIAFNRDCVHPCKKVDTDGDNYSTL